MQTPLWVLEFYGRDKRFLSRMCVGQLRFRKGGKWRWAALAALAWPGLSAALEARAPSEAGDAGWVQRVQRACQGPLQPPALPQWLHAPPGAAPETEVWRRGPLRVIWQGDYLKAVRVTPPGPPGPFDGAEMALPQPDYGQVREVKPDRAGGLVALADQVSYRIAVTEVEGTVRLGPRVAFPVLWTRPCGRLQRWVGGCQPSRAFYSPALKAGLMEGYDGSGQHRVAAMGLLPNGDVRWLPQDGATPKAAGPEGLGWRVLGEAVTERGVILLSTRQARVFHDGDRHAFCPPP
jgi:hypothetical protein